ncbi:MAG: hypothetical protein HC772_17680 [Leptolyngbyaceae cyanobacterium CRU_2_3]|nr:hypothetical protein [Leptolyngbyaceae cyanobacterium CRU_2_3]
MIWIDLAQLAPHFASHLADVASWHMGQELLSSIGNGASTGYWTGTGYWDESHLAALLNTDVFANTRNFFNNFIKSGQVWALCTGLILGYLIRGFLSYGS